MMVAAIAAVAKDFILARCDVYEVWGTNEGSVVRQREDLVHIPYHRAPPHHITCIAPRRHNFRANWYIGRVYW